MVKKSFITLLLSMSLVASYLYGEEGKSSVTRQLSQMIEEQLADLDVAIGHAKKSHENFNKEDAEYVAAKHATDGDDYMSREYITNVQVKNIVDPSNLRTLNSLLPLKNKLTRLDFYKGMPTKPSPKSEKRKLFEKTNERIDRYTCGMSMIEEKMEKLDMQIKKIQSLQSHNELLPAESDASNTLIEVKRKHKAELKEHKNAMKKAVQQLKKHRVDLD